MHWHSGPSKSIWSGCRLACLLPNFGCTWFDFHCVCEWCVCVCMCEGQPVRNNYPQKFSLDDVILSLITVKILEYYLNDHNNIVALHTCTSFYFLDV